MPITSKKTLLSLIPARVPKIHGHRQRQPHAQRQRQTLSCDCLHKDHLLRLREVYRPRCANLPTKQRRHALGLDRQGRSQGYF